MSEFEQPSSEAEDEEMALTAPDTPGEIMEQMTRASAEETPEPLSPPSGLGRASDLLPPDYDEDEGDFEPGHYKGFEILPKHLWPADEWTPRHAERWGEQRFYVSSPSGMPGLVPWPGSQVVWPWERAWSVDLHRTEVESFLKDEKKEAKRK